ncbi:MAG: thioesterase domain-containing protein [Pirellulaceae bacterium]|nr:thioesterase domain-containing protein [Pirellulaceae bacterium]
MKLSVTLVENCSGPPLFIVPSAATTSLSLTLLARSISPPRPIHSFVFPDLEDKRIEPQTVEEMGTQFVSEMKSIQPEGPYFLAGHCFGATPAMEVVTQLEAAGETVALLILIESFSVGIAETAVAESTQPLKLYSSEYGEDLGKAATEIVTQIGSKLSLLPIDIRDHFTRVTTHHLHLAFSYRAKPITAPIFQIRTTQHPETVFKGWDHLTTDGYIERLIGGTTDSILQAPDVTTLANEISDALIRFS